MGGVAHLPLRASTLVSRVSYLGSRTSSPAENVPGLLLGLLGEQLLALPQQLLQSRLLPSQPLLRLPMATMTTTPTTAKSASTP